MHDVDSRAYKIQDVIGRGGFGTVYRAELLGPSGFAKPVAIKVMNADTEGVADLVARLRDEARMLGRLQHRSIVRVDSLAQIEGRWAVIMEFAEGVSARALAEKVSIPPGVVLAIVEEVADALAFAWTAPGPDGTPMHLLHRDVKPSNVQLTTAGEVKLLDFGVARAAIDDREASTKAVVLGSVPYLAPERLELHDEHVSDVYALGVTMVELLAGQMPGRSTADRSRHEERLTQTRQRLELIGAGAELIAFCLDLLAFDYTARPVASEVARRARELGRSIDGPVLRDWLPAAVKKHHGAYQPEQGPWSGSLVQESGVHPADIGASTGSVPAIRRSLTTLDVLEEVTFSDHDMPDGMQSGLHMPVLPSAPAGFPSAAPAPERGSQPTTPMDLGAVRAQLVAAVDEQAPRKADAAVPAKGGLSPVAESAPAAKGRAPQKRAARGWFIPMLTVITLTVSAIILLILAGGVAAGSLVSVLFAWIVSESMPSVAHDTFREHRTLIESTVTPSPERDRVLAVLDVGMDEVWTRDVGLVELALFETTLEQVCADGLISRNEASTIERNYASLGR